MKLEKNSGSKIIALIKKLSSNFYSKIPTSLTGSFLSGKLGSADTGLIRSIVDKIAFNRRVSTPVKRIVARAFDRSTILNAISGVMKLLPLIQIRTIGLFAFCFGAFTSISSLIGSRMSGDILTDPNLILGLTAAVIGALLSISQKSCYQAVRESRIASIILFRLLGLKTSDSLLQSKPIILNHWGIILGLSSGLLGLFIGPHTVLSVPFVFLTFYTLLCSPESGVVLIFLLLPVLSENKLAALSLFVGFSYLLKLLRGKRTFKLNFVCLSVLAFAVSLFIGGVASVTPAESFKTAIILLSLIASYFVTVNTVKTAVWVRRCCSAILLSFGFTLITGLTGKLASAFSGRGVTSLIALLPSDVTSLFSFNSVLTVMCVAFLPFLLIGAFMNRTEGSRFIYFCGIAVSLYCIVAGHSFGALISAIFSAALLLLIVKKSSFGAVAATAVALPTILSLLPSPILKSIADTVGLSSVISGLSSEPTSSTAKMIRSTILGGIGLGDEALKRVYPIFSESSSHSIQGYGSLYTALTVSLGIVGTLIFAVLIITLLRLFFSYLGRSKDDVPYLRYTSVAAFTSVISLTVMGITDNIFSEPTVFALFFLLTAITVSTVSVADSERRLMKIDGPYVSLSIVNNNQAIVKGDNVNEQSEQ